MSNNRNRRLLRAYKRARRAAELREIERQWANELHALRQEALEDEQEDLYWEQRVWERPEPIYEDDPDSYMDDLDPIEEPEDYFYDDLDPYYF
jgi:hypothetical protein